MNNPKDMLVSEIHCCSQRVYKSGGSFRGSPCSKKATVKDASGNWWCGTHSPEAVAKRKAAFDERFKKRDFKFMREADALTAMRDELTKLRSERDELVGALSEVVYQADEGMPIIDVSPCIVKASKLLAKHKPE